MIGTIVSPACDQAQYIGAEISQRHKIAKKQGIYFNASPGTHDIAPQARKQRVRQQMEVPGRCLSPMPMDGCSTKRITLYVVFQGCDPHG